MPRAGGRCRKARARIESFCASRRGGNRRSVAAIIAESVFRFEIIIQAVLGLGSAITGRQTTPAARPREFPREALSNICGCKKCRLALSESLRRDVLAATSRLPVCPIHQASNPGIDGPSGTRALRRAAPPVREVFSPCCCRRVEHCRDSPDHSCPAGRVAPEAGNVSFRSSSDFVQRLQPTPAAPGDVRRRARNWRRPRRPASRRRPPSWSS